MRDLTERVFLDRVDSSKEQCRAKKDAFLPIAQCHMWFRFE